MHNLGVCVCVFCVAFMSHAYCHLKTSVWWRSEPDEAQSARTLHQSLHVTPVPHAHGIEPMTAGHLERPAASCQSETTDSMLASIGGHWCCWTIFRNPTHPTDEERLVISNKNKVLPEKGGGGGARAAVVQQLELVVERREDPPSPASDRVSALDHTHRLAGRGEASARPPLPPPLPFSSIQQGGTCFHLVSQFALAKQCWTENPGGFRASEDRDDDSCLEPQAV